MDESNYKRLTCSAFTCASDHKAKGLCATHYMQSRREAIKPRATHCHHCGEPWSSPQSNAMYCSKKCKQAAWAKANPEKVQLNAKNKAARERLVTASVIRRCSKCESVIGDGSRAKVCRPCRLEDDRAKSTIRVESTHKATALVVSCAGCGAEFCPLYGYSHASLCTCCRADRDLQAKRTHRLARKMRQKVQTVEAVNSIKVFERDGWRCQLCRRKTPRALRGTLDSRAPELDHIMPISLGGEHSYRNTQCTCRACNGAKSNKPLGQSLLFG